MRQRQAHGAMHQRSLRVAAAWFSRRCCRPRQETTALAAHACAANRQCWVRSGSARLPEDRRRDRGLPHPQAWDSASRCSVQKMNSHRGAGAARAGRESMARPSTSNASRSRARVVCSPAPHRPCVMKSGSGRIAGGIRGGPSRQRARSRQRPTPNTQQRSNVEVSGRAEHQQSGSRGTTQQHVVSLTTCARCRSPMRELRARVEHDTDISTDVYAPRNAGCTTHNQPRAGTTQGSIRAQSARNQRRESKQVVVPAAGCLSRTVEWPLSGSARTFSHCGQATTKATDRGRRRTAPCADPHSGAFGSSTKRARREARTVEAAAA